jgi:para-nitrobenzyl esterase
MLETRQPSHSTPRPQWRARFAACAAALSLPLLLAACGGGGGAATTSQLESRNLDGGLVRTTHLGDVRGSANAGVFSWKGVPYAKPPVGDLRWQPPQEPVAWTKVRDTKEFGPACAQYGRIYGPGANNRYDETIGTTLNQVVGREDCLYLNIWRPAGSAQDLPVIVFFHGGSNVSGYTADPMYDGAALAKAANAVVVTPNFRLGILGFFNLAQLKTGSDPRNDSGNFTMLDSIKALQFVRTNARAFGGNPDNVTIMGQSAGAINVWALQTSPEMVAANPKLFHRNVPLSGGISLATNLPAGSIPTLNPPIVSQLQGAALLQNLVMSEFSLSAADANAWIAARTPAQIAAYMRAKSPSQLFTTLLTKLAVLGLAGSGPIPDGTIVASDPINAIALGNYVKVPVLAGNTRDEGKLFPSFLALPQVGGTGNARIPGDAALFSNHFSYDPNAAPQTTIDQWITAPYLPVDAPVTGFTARAEKLNQIFFLASRTNVLDTLKTQQSNVWYYRFDWDKQPAPWNDIYGAVHVVDLPFFFGNFGPSLFSNVWFSAANEPGRLELSATMMQTLSTFARNGDPNNAAIGAAWPTWPGKMVFNATLTNQANHAE